MGKRTLYTENIKFPATQQASTDANTFDDYEEGVWTPTLTFVTPGTLSIGSYSSRAGWYIKKGLEVTAWWNINAVNVVPGTASGSLKITGLPTAGLSVSGDASGIYAGATSFAGINKAGYTQITPYVAVSDAELYFIASGMNQAYALVGAADVPSGGTVVMRGCVQFRAAT